MVKGHWFEILKFFTLD